MWTVYGPVWILDGIIVWNLTIRSDFGVRNWDLSCSDFSIPLYIIKFYDLQMWAMWPIKYSFFLFQVPGTCVVRVLATEGEHAGIIQQTSILVTNTTCKIVQLCTFVTAINFWIWA